MSDKDTGGASIVGLIVKEFPEKALGYLAMMDRQGIYGSDIYLAYNVICQADCIRFLTRLADGTLPDEIKARGRG